MDRLKKRHCTTPGCVVCRREQATQMETLHEQYVIDVTVFDNEIESDVHEDVVLPEIDTSSRLLQITNRDGFPVALYNAHAWTSVSISYTDRVESTNDDGPDEPKD